MSKGSMEPVRITSGELKETRTIAGKLTIPPRRTVAPMYADLPDKPSINRHTIEGDKMSAEYGLQDKMDVATQAEIEAILYIDV